MVAEDERVRERATRARRARWSLIALFALFAGRSLRAGLAPVDRDLARPALVERRSEAGSGQYAQQPGLLDEAAVDGGGVAAVREGDDRPHRERRDSRSRDRDDANRKAHVPPPCSVSRG